MNQKTFETIKRYYLSQIQKCVKCGACLHLCPIYKVSSKEEFSPRGKIALLQAMNYIELANLLSSDQLEKYLTSCLQCRNCQQTCNNELCLDVLYIIGKFLSNHRKYSNIIRKYYYYLEVFVDGLLGFALNLKKFIKNLKLISFYNSKSNNNKFINHPAISLENNKNYNLIFDIRKCFQEDLQMNLQNFISFFTQNNKVKLYFDIKMSWLFYIVYEVINNGDIESFWFLFNKIISEISADNSCYIIIEPKYLYLLRLSLELSKIQNDGNLSANIASLLVSKICSIYLIFSLEQYFSIIDIKNFFKSLPDNVKYTFICPYFEQRNSNYSIFDSYYNFCKILGNLDFSYKSKNFYKICFCNLYMNNKSLFYDVIKELISELQKNRVASIVTTCYGCYMILKSQIKEINAYYLVDILLDLKYTLSK